jgi:hypothetical protein
MAPTDRISLPFRWSFIPEQNPKDGSIRWKWCAYTHDGKVALQSDATFDTFTECMEDAKARGYGRS